MDLYQHEADPAGGWIHSPSGEPCVTGTNPSAVNFHVIHQKQTTRMAGGRRGLRDLAGEEKACIMHLPTRLYLYLLYKLSTTERDGLRDRRRRDENRYRSDFLEHDASTAKIET